MHIPQRDPTSERERGHRSAPPDARTDSSGNGCVLYFRRAMFQPRPPFGRGEGECHQKHGFPWAPCETWGRDRAAVAALGLPFIRKAPVTLTSAIVQMHCFKKYTLLPGCDFGSANALLVLKRILRLLWNYELHFLQQKTNLCITSTKLLCATKGNCMYL